MYLASSGKITQCIVQSQFGFSIPVVVTVSAMALLGSLLWDSLAAIGLLLFVTYRFATSEFDFFKKRGVPFAPPIPFIGSFLSVLRGKDSLRSACVPLYKKFKKNRFGGVFAGRHPGILICDLDLAKTVLTKDFSSVHDRGMPYDEKNNPLSATLVNMPGAKWKNLRNKLTPTFTSGKLKMMFPLIKECSDELSAYLQESASKGEEVEMLSLLKRYCTDVVGSCAFGISCNSIRNPESEFYKMSRMVARPSLLRSIRSALFSSSAFISKLIPNKWLFPGVQNFFINLMKDTVTYRKANNVERNDFVQLLMQLQENDEGKSPKDYPDEVIFSIATMAAQAFVFFVAGLDTVANTVGFALWHVTIDQRLQEDLFDEVISVIRNHNGELTYEALKEMHLLERIINESLRMYTPGGLIFRAVTSPSYTIPGSNVTVKKGTKIWVHAEGFHYDPEIYPEPHKFDPDRFTEEASSKRHPYAFLPFGEGPRVCIGNRLGMLESKLCLAALVKDFKFSVGPNTKIPFELETRTFGPSPKGGWVLKLEKRLVS